MKKAVLLMVTILVLAFGIGITAKAASVKGEGTRFSKEQYRIMEDEFQKEARMILLEKGCKNAGIMLTYVTDAEGMRVYTITVHHSRLEDMEEQEMKVLEARLQERGWEVLMANVSMKKL